MFRCLECGSKIFHLFVILLSILEASEAFSQLRIPLTMPNDLQISDIWLGTNDDEEAFLLVFWESCAVIKTVNILVHKWVITHHPHLVEIYEQFDARDAFEPIKYSWSLDIDVLTKTDFKLWKNWRGCNIT